MSKLIILLFAFILIMGCSDTVNNPVISPDKDVIVEPHPLSLYAYVSSIDPPMVTIQFMLPIECDYKFAIRNATGYTIKEARGHAIGNREIFWDLKTEKGELINKGYYIFEIIMNPETAPWMCRSTIYIDIG